MAVSPPSRRAEAVVACRRLNLGDAMILTAAAAVALVPPTGEFILDISTQVEFYVKCGRHLLGWRFVPDMVGRVDGVFLAKHMINFALGLLGGPLCGITLAVIWLRFRQPRPGRAELFHQPGFVACVAAVLGFVIFLEAKGLGFACEPPATIAGSIAAAWVALAASRRWRPEPGWIDHLGWCVGVAWIAAAACDAIERRL